MSKLSSMLSSLSNLKNNRTLLAISICELLRVMAGSGAWVFIPIYLVTIRNIPYIIVGLLFLISSLLTIPTSIYGGNLIDRIGRKKIALLMPPFIMILYLTMSISIYLDSSILLIFAAFISIGPLSSVQYITDTVMITDTTPEKERINAYSIIRITSNIGFSIGPALGGIVVIFNYAYVALIPAIGAIAELFLYLRLVTETLPEKKVEKNKRANLSFPYEDRLFILIAFLLAMSWFATSPWQYITNQFFSKAYTLSGWEIGMLFSVNGLTVISLQLPINTLLKRISDMNRMSLGLVVYASTFFVIGLTRNLYLLVIDVIFLTCGENIISPPTSNIIAKIAPPNRRGVYFGSFSMINGIVSPFSPVFYEYLLSLLISEPIMLWGIVSIICVVLSVTLFLFQRAKKV